MAKRASSPRAVPPAAKPLPPLPVKMIISGGQTGVDRAALEIAIELSIPHGGFCPRGRLAEDGPIPAHFLLKETESDRYYVRTECNVLYAEGTLILYRGRLSRGTTLTRKYAQRHRKPSLCVSLKPGREGPQIARIRTWLHERRIQVLNIAGPRESSAVGIAAEAKNFLRQLLVPPRPQSAAKKPAKSRKTK